MIREVAPGASGLLYICCEVLFSFAGHADVMLLAALACLLLLPMRYVLFRRGDSWRPSVLVPAAAIAACMVLGRSYDVEDSARLALGDASRIAESILAWLGWAVLAHVGIYLLFEWFDRLGAPGRSDGAPRSSSWGRATRFILDRHPFGGPLLLVSITWSFAFIAACPGIFMGDTPAQILQWFNLPNATSSYLDLVNPSVLLNGHHPVVHTALLGGCVQIGLALFGDENAGLLIYTATQFALTAAAVAYLLYNLRLFGLGIRFRAAMTAFFLFMPMFANYAVLLTKDVLFADALLLLVIQLAKVLTALRASRPDALGCRCSKTTDLTRIPVCSSGLSARTWIALGLAALGTTFLRNGGLVFPVVACLLTAGIARLRSQGRIVAGSLAVLAVVAMLHIGFSAVLMPALGITPGSRREAMSIPFQQTARFVAKHDSAHAGVSEGTSDGLVSAEERAAIDRVLGYATLARRYDPSKSDGVKDSFNEHASSADLMAYLSVWATMFSKDPAVYLSATANNYFGYFYPSERDVWVYSTVSSEESMSSSSLRAHFDFHRLGGPISEALDHAVLIYRVAVQRCPLVSLAMSSAPYVWLLVLTSVYELRSRQWFGLALLAPIWCVLAVCITGPCNGSTYMRYLYPAIVCLPFVVPIAIGHPRILWIQRNL